MPIQIEEGKTPKGQRLMRCRVHGHVSLADAEGMSAQMKPGMPYHQALAICVVEKSTDYDPAARKHFDTMNPLFTRMATVVHSAVLRAMINFMHRVFGAPGNFRLFNSEAEALAWLDQE